MKINHIYSLIFACLMACAWVMPVLAQEQQQPVVTANTQKVTGTVISIVDDKPMQGVTVRVEGITGSFRETDANGSFTIDVPSQDITLSFAFPGFREFSMFLGDHPDLKVKMIPENHPSSLDQVVLTPGNIRQKRFTTQAYQIVGEEELDSRPYPTVERYLYGKVAGMNVTAVNGMPGAATSMNIRGVGSVLAGSQPLYIVDGMEVSNIEYIKDMHDDSYNTQLYNSKLMGVNVNDIQSITVLKDAAAKAVYGSRGGNGVIVIETGKGEKGNSKIDLSINQGFDFKGKDIPMLNADESRQYLIAMAYSQYYDANKVMVKYGDALFNNPSSLIYEKYNNSTNWPDVIQKNTGYFGDYHFRIRGGDDVAKYSFSVGMFDKKGIIENTDMNKLSARFNLDYDVTEWCRIGTNLYFTRLMQDRAAMGFSKFNPLLLAYQKSPITTPYIQNKKGIDTPEYENYDVFLNSNPLALLNVGKNEYANNLMGGKMFGDFFINKEWMVALSIGLHNQTAQDKMFIPAKGVAPFRDMERISEQTYIEDLMLDSRLEVRYHAKFNELHTIGATIGGNFLNDQLSYRLGRTYNVTNDQYTSLSGERDLLGSYSEEWRMLAGYLQGNYMFKERYIADVTLRVDGSSRFGLESRAAFYPALGLAWRMSQESFMNAVSWIDELKLRASAGCSGNDNIGNYSSRLLYVPANYKNLGGISLGQLSNEQLKPEQIVEYDLGVDLGVWNQRVNLSVDVYDRTTRNMVLPVAVPLESGSKTALMNAGKINNRGIEAALSLYFHTGDFQWNVGGNFAYNKNKITKMPGNMQTVAVQYDEFTALATYNQPVGVYYGYQTNGIFATDADAAELANGSGYKYEAFQGGDVRFVDQDKNGVIDEKDMVFIGKSMPDIIGGVNFQVSWKGITLGALIDGQWGREVVNGTRYKLESMKDYSNQTVAANRRWQQPGDITNMPRMIYDDPVGNSRFSDRWVEDGSFVRLRSVSLSYDFPKYIVQKIKLNKIRLFVNAENILTYSKYLGFDPEFNHLNSDFISGVDATSMYVPRNVTFGIRIGL